MADRMKASEYAMAGILMCCLGHSVMASATEAPRLSIQAGGKHSGMLNDGDIIRQGHLATQDVHVGFRVWSDTARQGNAPNRYTIAGGRNGGNVLHVRVEKDEGHPDTGSGKGLIIDTANDVTSFNIVSDGVQSVVADNYLLELKGAAIERDGGGAVSLSGATIQTVSLDFNAEQLLRNELWAVLPVFPTALADNTLMARGLVSTLDSSPRIMAVRFALGAEKRGGDVKRMVLSGDNDSTHRLKVRLQFPEQDNVVEHSEWMVKTIAHSALDYTINADGAQDVPADKYTVRVEAALWSE